MKTFLLTSTASFILAILSIFSISHVQHVYQVKYTDIFWKKVGFPFPYQHETTVGPFGFHSFHIDQLFFDIVIWMLLYWILINLFLRLKKK